MDTCKQFKHGLLKHGSESALLQEQFETHLSDCDKCQALLHDWDRIPGLLQGLQQHEPDAALLRRTRQLIGKHTETPAAAKQRLPRLATSLASIVVLLAVIGLSRQFIDSERPALIVPASKEEYALNSGYRTESSSPSGQRVDGPLDLSEQILNGSGWEAESQNHPATLESIGAGIDPVRDAEPRQQAATPAPVNESILLAGKLQVGGALTSKPDFEKDAGNRERQNKQEAKKNRESQDTFADVDKLARLTPESEIEKADSEFGNYTAGVPLEGRAKSRAKSNQSFDFLSHYQTTEQLIFQPAQGYWANTHVPGDPNIRLLKARLAKWDRSGLNRESHLEQDVRPVSQPFDAPADNALALNLMSDANAVDGATRMRLQVGIRGIEHRRGQRPAMNLGVVIDLPADADDSTRIAARALLDAVLASKQAGDRFSLVINGPGGLLVPPDEFRFGPLQLARQAIIGGEKPVSNGSRGLQDAIRDISELVRQTDDPSQPLGSSSILLVSASDLGNVDALSRQIHAQAKDGITLSVVPLGKRPQSSQIEQLVLAGLGNRRVLQAPDQARQLVEAELHSSSRAVARAARLSIRLAPGVHLIDVVGSTRLDAERSQRVREIENSMDRRLSANLGIQADRGEDEDGIQIVIPSIFSGDDVTVLIDVMVERPGDIANVSLRYKDLVYLHNGSLRGQLSLPAGQLQRGPAEHAVLKNLLAHHFSTAAGRAADALGQQKTNEAVAILSDIRAQIVNLRGTVPAFSQDPDLLRDEQILDSYITLLASPGAGNYQPELTDSLRYAAWAKAHRPPVEWK